MLEKKYLRRWFPSGFLYTKFKHSFIYCSNPELSNLRPFFNNNVFQQYNNFRHKSVNHNFHFITSLVSGIERGEKASIVFLATGREKRLKTNYTMISLNTDQ